MIPRYAHTLVESELKKLMLAKAGGEYAIKTVAPAQAPKLRVRPKRTQIAVIGFMLGGVIGVLAVFTRNTIGGQAAHRA